MSTDFGARPLKRAVQEQGLNPLSLRLLEGEFKAGDKIKVTAKGDELVFEKKKLRAALVALQSGHFAKVKDAGKARQRLEYGSFRATFGRCASAEN